jgi:hypothetical protein
VVEGEVQGIAMIVIDQGDSAVVAAELRSRPRLPQGTYAGLAIVSATGVQTSHDPPTPLAEVRLRMHLVIAYWAVRLRWQHGPPDVTLPNVFALQLRADDFSS